MNFVNKIDITQYLPQDDFAKKPSSRKKKFIKITEEEEKEL